MVKCLILKGGFTGGCPSIFLSIHFISVNISNKASTLLSPCCLVYLKTTHDFECAYYKLYVGDFYV